MQNKKRRYSFGVWPSGLALALAVNLLASGCAMQKEDYEGTWIVTETLQPGIAAMSPNQAGQQLGASITYLDDQAQLGQHHCSSPHYASRTLPAGEVMQHYRVAPDALFGNNDKVREIQVSCDEAGPKLGQTLLLQPDGAAYTVIDGVFFRLEKAASQTDVMS
ncbi:hypothetical protein [Alteromonas halophila]|uniref:Lipoprotein n=1 Tax=Alteromonas halophila TaxID=516698 RepID=A0A918MXF8_9ALTE|nr:hypothetical protein [Alteromonas halophila]GGW83627.1 hypothetical protein GCM10007391_16500 [Alteromonas halophila]